MQDLLAEASYTELDHLNSFRQKIMLFIYIKIIFYTYSTTNVYIQFHLMCYNKSLIIFYPNIYLDLKNYKYFFFILSLIKLKLIIFFRSTTYLETIHLKCHTWWDLATNIQHNFTTEPHHSLQLIPIQPG